MHDYSNGPLTQWQRFVASSDKLGEIARGQGRAAAADDLGLCRSTRDDHTVGESVYPTGKRIGATVIPVGLAFAAAS